MTKSRNTLRTISWIKAARKDFEAFPDRANFKQLKSGGQLISPDEAARRVLAYLARPDFGAEPVADVRG